MYTPKYGVVPPSPVEQLDKAVARNAELVVLLRRLMGRLHRLDAGHQGSRPWPTCEHPECRAVARLLDAT